jgi:acetylornithine/N-succinyldiaminopimelate aminotransferase
VAKSFVFGSHGSTYGGNPLACAVANKVLELVTEPKLLAGVNEKRGLFEKELHRINTKYPFFDEIRGMGLLIGLGLKAQFKGKSKEFVTAGIEAGVIVLQAGLDTVRLAPPLNIDEKDIYEGMKRFEEMLKVKFAS